MKKTTKFNDFVNLCNDYKNLTNFFIVSVFFFPFFTSFILENFMNLIPCILCFTERWIHFLSGILSLMTVFFYGKNNIFGKKILFSLLLVLVANLLLTRYHIGVEYGEFSSECNNFKITNFFKIKEDCSIAKYFLGVKLTFWNVLYVTFEILVLMLFLKIKLTIKNNK